jgi:ribonuclease-3
MEEEPTMLVPDPEKEQQDFLISGQETVVDSQGDFEEVSQSNETPETPEISDILSDDELDFSHITHKEKSREDIIAEAEAAAFSEE